MIIDFPDKLKELPKKDFILIPFFSDDSAHYLNNELCGIFISILNSTDEYIITFNHNECINLDINLVFNYINGLKCKKYVYRKKSIFKYVDNYNDFFDIESIYYILTNKSLTDSYNISSSSYKSDSEKHIRKLFPTVSNINRYIPILKIQESMSKSSYDIKLYVTNNKLSDDNTIHYNFMEKTISEFYKIESNGLFVDKEKLIEYFPHYSSNIDSNNLIYSEYNLYTITGRPSNSFDRLNFAAMNKENGTRKSIVSRYGKDGMLIMFDYDAYHLAIISKIVNYTFPDGIGIHEYLGRIYYGKDTLTSDEYAKSKEVSFQILYGGIDDSVAKEIEFFGTVKQFVSKMHDSYQNLGYVESPISNKRFYRDNIGDMNENKLFNYMLQELETSRNVNVIQNLNFLLKNTKTKLILYLYDAFVYDFYIPEGKELLKNITSVMEDNNVYKTKIYYGDTLHNMKKIT
jgi:hypothetical protein